jgi:hypothetical protein
MGDRLRRYLAQLDAALADDADRERILGEVADHLEQSVAALDAGLGRDRAEEMAIGRLGRPADLAAEFAHLARPTPDARARSAGVVGFVAVVGLTAISAWSLVDPDPVAARLPRVLAQGAAALAAAALAVLLLAGRWQGSVRRVATVILCAVVILAGFATVIGTVELGRTSGDMEWYGVGIGAALAIQGLLGAWVIGRTRGARPA